MAKFTRVCLFVALGLTIRLNADTPRPPEDIDTILGHITDPGDIRTANDAVLKAVDFKYAEVVRALIDGLNRADIEIPRVGTHPNAYFVRHVLNALGEIGGTTAEVAHLRRAEDNFKRLISKLPPAEQSELQRTFTALVRGMQANFTPLPTLTAAAPLTPLRGSSLTPVVPRVRKEAADGAPTGALAPVPAPEDVAPIVPAAAPAAPAREPLPDTRALIKASGKAAEKSTDTLLKNVERNMYDDFVALLNAGEALPQVPHRDAEIDFVGQVMRRVAKSHLMLIGKQGTGKTELLKKLQGAWLTGELSHPGEKPPLVLELAIPDITNPSDPTAIKDRVRGAKLLAAQLDRHVIVFVDEASVMTSMTRNALKNFLSEKNGLVHVVINTTAREARVFKADPAFERRWTVATLAELDLDKSIDAVRGAMLKTWQRVHARDGVAFADVSDDAFRFAAKYAPLEQPHAGQPTGLQELLDATIVHRHTTLARKLRETGQLDVSEKDFVVEPEHVRQYLKFKTGQKLFPGDPDFEKVFAEIWTALKAEYQGQAGLLASLRETMQLHFNSFDREMVLALANFGPPGAGKSYLAEMLAKHFFGGALKPINAGMFSDGDFPLNVLIGSPSGTVGSEEQRSVLTEFMQDHPNGGVIVFEEADFLPQTVLDFLADSISRRGFLDGLGQWWNLDNFVLILNSNVGQELLLPEARTTWTAYEARRSALVRREMVGGEDVEMVRPEKLESVFDQFKMKVARGRHGDEVDEAQVKQNAMKLNRRIKPLYSLLPARENLLAAAKKRRDDYVANKFREYGVAFVIPDEVLEAVIDLDHYRFDQGYTYVQSQIDKKLTKVLDTHLSRRDRDITVGLRAATYRLGRLTVPGQELVVHVSGDDAEHVTPLGVAGADEENQWALNDDMRERIRTFPVAMSQRVRHQSAQIQWLHEQLKAKSKDWDTNITLAQIGANGVGRSHLAYALAEVLFETRDAVIEIPLRNTPEELQNEFRSPVGFVGNREETEFERRVRERRDAGGGVILLRNYLSFDGLSEHGMGQRLAILNKLKPLFTKRELFFGKRREDMRGFVVVLTGSPFADQLAQFGDGPGQDGIMKKLRDYLTDEQVNDYFRQVGLDADLIKSFGRTFVNSPLPKVETHRVAQGLVDQMVRDTEAREKMFVPLAVKIDPGAVRAAVDRVSNVHLGMKHVRSALDTLLVTPLQEILFDLDGAREVAATHDADKMSWTVEGRAVVPSGLRLDDEVVGTRWAFADEVTESDRREPPAITDLPAPKSLAVTPENSRLTVRHEWGHWITKFLFTGKSEVLSVSAIPRGNALGAVSSLPEKEMDVMGLSALLREMAVLAAGAQAGFRAGVFATGAGYVPSGGPGDKQRNDDYGKIERLIKATIHNGLLRGLSEHTPPRRLDAPKTFLRELADRLADFALAHDAEIGTFRPLYDTFESTKFLDNEGIDAFLKTVDLRTVTPPDDLFLRGLAQALTETHERLRPTLDTRAFDGLGRLVVEIYDKCLRETVQLNDERRARGVDVPAVDRAAARTRGEELAREFGCESALGQ